MITIRKEQMAAFEAAQDPLFAARLCVLLRQFQPDDTAHYGERALQAFVLRSLRRARTHGFRSERSLGDFVSLGLRIGESFDCQPDIVPLLMDATLGELRMRVIAGSFTNAEWHAMRVACFSTGAPRAT